MAKQKEREGTIDDLAPILSEIGKDAVEGADAAKRLPMVRDAAKEKGITFPQTDSTLKQYIDKARKSLGWVKTRNRGGSSGGGGGGSQVTIAEVIRARDLATRLKMKPDELLTLVEDISTFGALEDLEECLKALIDLTEAKK